jgi:lysozyme
MTGAPYFPLTMSDVVIDLSHWENPIDFTQLKAGGIAAVILKATQGIDFVDPTFASRAVTAHAGGLLVGAYHYFDASEPTAQAGYFLATIARTGVPMLMALDFEPNAANPTSEDRAAVFLTAVKTMLGRWPVLYTGRWAVAPANPSFSQCALWLAEYGTSPILPPGWSEWKLWQYTDGRIGSSVAPAPGVGPCDRSRFAGSTAQLSTWWINPTP